MGDTTTEMWHAGLAAVRARIDAAAARSGRSGRDVRVVAAVKYYEPEATFAVVAGGIDELAENRLEQLVARRAAFDAAGDGIVRPRQWHYIGRVQSRQAVDIAMRVDMIHALTSTRAVARLARAVEDDGLALPQLLVQVNADADPSKDGLALADVERWLEDLPASIAIAGFMTMPAITDDPADSRGAFDTLRELRNRLAPAFTGRHPLSVLSMGTSQDFEIAVEEGATHVRLGRILAAETE